MQTASLSDIQKNIALLGKLKEPLRIFDGRKKLHIATVYPAQIAKKGSIVDKLAGSMSKNNHLTAGMSWKEIREKSWELHVKDKKW